MVIFLDLDGVANSHKRHPNSPYCGIDPACMARLNRILEATEADIVISSSWRYLVLGGAMTLAGFTYMLQTHGLSPDARIIGTTRADPDPPPLNEDGWRERAKQIREYVAEHKVGSWIAIDDAPLALPPRRFVQTRGDCGLRERDVELAIRLLKGERE